MAAAAPGGTFHSQMHFSAISVSQYVSIALSVSNSQDFATLGCPVDPAVLQNRLHFPGNPTDMLVLKESWS